MIGLDRSVRIRGLLQTWFVVCVLVLALAAAMTGWWAYQVNVAPDVTEDEQLVDQWSESSSYDHSATILTDTLPFDAGETVANRPIYYTNLSSELDGTYEYQYDDADGEVTVQTETFVLIRAGEMEDQHVVETYWEVVEPLESSTETAVGPGDAHTVDFTVDIPVVLETIATVEEQVGATEGVVDVRVVSITDVEGEVDGESVTRSHQSDMIMVVSPETFRVAHLEVVDESHQSFETVEVLSEPGPLERYGSIALFVLVTAALLGTVVARAGGYLELTDDERELLTAARHREQYADWITAGRFPSERTYEQTVLVDDLEGLIDVAIDTNKRVIEDPQLGVSTVLDDEYIYVYVRPDSPARDWLVNYADTTLDEFEADAF